MLTGFFDSNLWRVLPFCIGQAEPAILQAIITLSAYHESSEQAASRDCSSVQVLADPGPVPRAALERYTAAIPLFRKNLFLGRMSPPAVQLGCLLFACIEFLRGDGESALVHIAGALKLTNSPKQNVPLDRDEISLAAFLSRLSLTQSLYGRPRTCEFPPLLHIPEGPPGPQGYRFCSLDEARMANVALTNSTFRFVRMAGHGGFPDSFTQLSVQRRLHSRLQDWHRAFEAFLASTETGIQHTRGPCILRVHHLMAEIFLISREPDPESAFDLSLSKFEAIVTLLESIESQGSPEARTRATTFGLDNGVIAPLFYTAIKCRDAEVRLRAISLLRRVPRYDGLWDAHESAHAAKIAMTFENRSRAADPHGKIPGWARVHDVDICPRDPADPSRQLVILRLKPDGIDEAMQDVHTYIHW